MVRALARSEPRLGWAREFVDEVIVAEATEPSTMHGVCEGVDTVITCLGITRQAQGHMSYRSTVPEDTVALYDG